MIQDVISALAISKDKVLLVEKKGVWILPGGKPNVGEESLDCLAREIREELPKVSLKIKKFLDNFTGISPHSEKEINVLVYECDIVGDIKVANEISDSNWIRICDLDKYSLSNVTKEILDFYCK